jgi:Aspartyl protease/PDZ domain
MAASDKPQDLIARPTRASDLFALFKAASGGKQWDDIETLREQGTLTAGGLSGPLLATREISTGRYSSRHKIGSIDGAGGYDGQVSWHRGPGGEIAVLDAAEAKRRARSQGWLDARAYWYPKRIPALHREIEGRELGGTTYHTVEVTPEDGDPIALWFAAETNLLARIVRPRGGDTVTTILDDYRLVEGVYLPFHSVTDRVDANGRIDARQRMETQLEQVAFNVAVTDDTFAIPAMTVKARIEDASGETCVPFDLINNHIYVDGKVDGMTVRFMVDTGGVNLLTPAAAQRIGLTGEGKLAARGPGEQATDVALARATQATIAAATLDDPVFYVVDLAQLPNAEGVEFDGLIGYEMFRHFCVQIDYANKRLTLIEPEKFVPSAGAVNLPIEFERLTPIVTGTLDGVPVRLTVDTGSRASLTLYSPFVRNHGLVAKYNASSESVLGWGVGGAARLHPARFGSLRLGNLDIIGIAGDLFTGETGALANSQQAGNLGGGVLKRFTVAFNYSAKRMYIAPNAVFGRSESFDRSGLWLLKDGAEFNVADVSEGSAAEHADIRRNDRISALGGENTGTRTLDEWRQLLRELPVGTALSIRLLREGERMNTELILTDRIPAQWQEVGRPTSPEE